MQNKKQTFQLYTTKTKEKYIIQKTNKNKTFKLYKINK